MTSSPGNARFLMPGEPEVDVFADASASDGFGVGPWAYLSPSFDLRGPALSPIFGFNPLQILQS